MISADIKTTVAQINAALATLNTPNPLSTATLSAPLLTTTSQRTTLSSETDSPTSITPSALAADLAHYKDLFSKLRFSYTEQVTKERFLKSIVSSPSIPISTTEIDLLSTKLLSDKASLKEKKEAVADALKRLEELARDVARREAEVLARTAGLAELPERIEGLEGLIEELRQRQSELNPAPDMNLSLDATVEVLEAREAALEEMEARIAELEQVVPRREEEVGEMTVEVQGLEERKRRAVDEAREMRKRRKGGMGDAVEVRGRWLRGTEKVMREWLEV
ncbi:hypothetical protein MBLNU457_6307t1 [Dothideomycetes sp. NU457]